MDGRLPRVKEKDSIDIFRCVLSTLCAILVCVPLLIHTVDFSFNLNDDCRIDCHWNQITHNRNECDIIFYLFDLNSFALEIRCNQFNCEKIGFDLPAVHISNLIPFLAPQVRFCALEGHSIFYFDYHKNWPKSEPKSILNEWRASLNYQTDTNQLPTYLNFIFNYYPQHSRTFTLFRRFEREVKWTLTNMWYDFRPNQHSQDWNILCNTAFIIVNRKQCFGANKPSKRKTSLWKIRNHFWWNETKCDTESNLKLD